MILSLRDWFRLSAVGVSQKGWTLGDLAFLYLCYVQWALRSLVGINFVRESTKCNIASGTWTLVRSRVPGNGFSEQGKK